MQEQAIDLTDGLRVTFVGGEVVHLRPSENAPGCRCYAEAADAARAQTLVEQYLDQLADMLLSNMSQDNTLTAQSTMERFL
jgi:phosphomannomutase